MRPSAVLLAAVLLAACGAEDRRTGDERGGPAGLTRYANAAVGDDVTPRRRAQLQAVLDSLRFRAVRIEDDRPRGG